MVSSHEIQAPEDDPHTIRMEFEPALYQCFENCGSLKLTVARRGGDSGVTVKVCVPLSQDSGIGSRTVYKNNSVCEGDGGAERLKHKHQDMNISCELISLTPSAVFLFLI